ncbi:ABC transporter permease [Pseudomonas rhodesiae]|uniref:ABC transporter permease n=1 Tax=Pseudomonas rhodesiae TaxID=76760 RepID=UPI0032B2B726
MKLLPVIFKRQLAIYAFSPATYFSVALFLALSATVGVYLNPWVEQGSGDLLVFFQLHPWLYLLLIPALTTQLWSDEADPGFEEMMSALPITAAERVIGKFMAAWVVAGMALMLCFPLVVAANYLGNADNGLIASQFAASWLLAGSYLSVGCFVCTLARQRVVTFILTIGLLLAASALSSCIDALERQTPIWIIDSLSALNPQSRFSTIDNGKFTLHDSLYFVSMMLTFLTATTITLNYKFR